MTVLRTLLVVSPQLALAAALLSVAQAQAQVTGQAQVYRCVNAAGKVEYQDLPCDKGGRGTVVDVRPNVIDSTGIREQALRLENERLKEQLKNLPAVAAVTPVAPGSVGTGEAAPKVDPVACRQARRDYEVTASSSANTKEIVRAKESAMYAECGIKDPQRQTVEVTIQRDEPTHYLVPRGVAPRSAVSAPAYPASAGRAP